MNITSKINKFYKNFHTRAACLNTLALKLIAIVSMTIDHIGVVMNPDSYYVMRSIGRIAFPVFCYLMAEGYIHTTSRKNYALRLLVFAFISQIPFCLMLYSKPYVRGVTLNVFFTLFLGLIAIICLDYGIKEYKSHSNDYFAMTLGIAATLLSIYAGSWLNTDYGAPGVTLIILFYLFRGHPLLTVIGLFAVLVEFASPVELYGMLALIPIFLHNGKKGPGLKYFFYAYYPVHMLALYLLKLYIL